MTFKVLCFAILMCVPMGAQDQHSKPEFEVATVRPSSRDQFSSPALEAAFKEARQGRAQKTQFPQVSADRIRIRGWSLTDLITVAYGVWPTQVSGPDWLSDSSFDVDAKVPIGTQKDDLNAMMRSLLEERFALKTHRAERTEQGYILIVSKNGPKLTSAPAPSGSAEKDADGRSIDEIKAAQAMKASNAMMGRLNGAHDKEKLEPGFTILSWQSISLKDLSQKLSQFTNAPVVDGTLLTGTFSVTLEFSKDTDNFGHTIFDAVQGLGLKLESRRITFEGLVVDHVNRTAIAD